MGNYSVAGMYDCNGRWAAGRSYVYLFMARDGDGPMYVKIGRSDDPVHRVRDVQVGCPFRIIKASMVKCASREQAKHVELALHRALEDRRSSGEWFRFDWGCAESRQALADALEFEFARIRDWTLEEIDLQKAARMFNALAAERQRRSRSKRSKKSAA